MTPRIDAAQSLEAEAARLNAAIPLLEFAIDKIDKLTGKGVLTKPSAIKPALALAIETMRDRADSAFDTAEWLRQQ